MKRIIITWMLLGVTWSSRLAGQRAPGTAACDSALRAARVDSVAVTARAYLARRDGELLPPRARALLLDAILAHLEVPKPLQLPVFGPAPVQLRILRRETLGDSLTIREPVVYGLYTFPIRRDGTVGRVATRIPSMVPGFDESVAAAIMFAVADSVMSMVGHALDQDSLALELRITTGGPEDSRARVPPATVFAATFPRLRLVDAKPVGTLPLPRYPVDERDDGRDGEALLRVVVDGSGEPVISTLEVLHATSPAFALEAATTLARYHFAPAHVGACPVPQVVLLPFWFSLRP